MHVDYEYDAEGRRVQKTIWYTNGTSPERVRYFYSGDKLVSETKYSSTYNNETDRYDFYEIHRINYIYESTGLAFVVLEIYNSNAYLSAGEYSFFVYRNAQGDITGLGGINCGGIRFNYSAYGEMSYYDSSDAGNFMFNNMSLLYRGYCYDRETGLYYVGSRFYDPQVGRWLSGDGQISGVGGEILGYNMFAYCMNNPVNMSDSTGSWPGWATKLIAAAAVVTAVVVTAATLGAAAPAAVCTLTSVGMSLGLSYTAATVAATAAVAITTIAAVAYAGDIACASITGNSPLKETLFQGNQEAYDAGLMITSVATGGVLQAATQSPGVCFIAGTPVLTKCGYKSIEQIKSGDMVWAGNPQTGEKELKEVVQTFVNETDKLIHLFINNEEIVTTPEHPFYVPNKGWINAIQLRAGDILVMQNDDYIVVEKVQYEILEAPITVYNFEVADFHTYYVGKNAVLVHNTCGNRNTPDQDAVIQLAKENRKGISMDDAKILTDWAKEYSIKGNPRIDMGHDSGNLVSRNPHLHIGPVNHIPIFEMEN